MSRPKTSEPELSGHWFGGGVGWEGWHVLVVLFHLFFFLSFLLFASQEENPLRHRLYFGQSRAGERQMGEYEFCFQLFGSCCKYHVVILNPVSRPSNGAFYYS